MTGAVPFDWRLGHPIPRMQIEDPIRAGDIGLSFKDT